MKWTFAVLYWLLTAAAYAAGIALVRRFAPAIEGMGASQKIFYLHMPTAVCMLAAALVVFVASVGYLWTRRMLWDDLAASAAKVVVVFGVVVLVTGSIWGHSAWGVWWTWSPKLTFSLVLFLLYLVYVIVRPAVDSPQRRAIVSAVFGVVAFLDVPLVWLSSRLMKDMHPANIQLEGTTVKLLLYWFIPALLMTAGLIVTRYRLARMQRAAIEGVRADSTSAGSAGGVQ